MQDIAQTMLIRVHIIQTKYIACSLENNIAYALDEYTADWHAYETTRSTSSR